MRTRKTTPADIPALKAIWNEAFAEDSRQDIDEFFETLYPNATGFCAEDETGCVCAMLFALPQTIVKGEKQLKAAYLYAVATKKEHRGQGYCRAVMAYAEKELRKRYGVIDNVPKWKIFAWEINVVLISSSVSIISAPGLR